MTNQQEAHIEAARTTIDALARAHGIEASDLIAAVQSADHAGGTTVLDYFDDVWARSVAGTSKTAKTYRNAVKLLVHGIRLEKTFRRPGAEHCEVKPWDDDRATQWLAAAARINDDRERSLSIPSLSTADRSDEGSVIVWHGLGHRPMQVLTGNSPDGLGTSSSSPLMTRRATAPSTCSRPASSARRSSVDSKFTASPWVGGEPTCGVASRDVR